MDIDKALSLEDNLYIPALVRRLNRKGDLSISREYKGNLYIVPYYYGGCLYQVCRLVDIIINENYRPTYKEAQLLDKIGIGYFVTNQLQCVICDNNAFLISIDVLEDNTLSSFCVSCVKKEGLIFSEYNTRLAIKGVN